MGDDDVDLVGDQLREQRGEAIVVAVGPTVVDDDVAPFLIAELAQACAKRVGAFGQAIGGGQTEKANPEEFAALLSARGA